MKKLILSLSIAVLIFANSFAQTNDSLKKIKIAVLVYPGVELLDFSGPVEVFSNVEKFEVFLVSTGEDRITTKNKTVTLIPDYTIENSPTPDILVVPGAPMNPVIAVRENAKVIDWIKLMNTKTKYTMSVCTGAFILNTAGILDGKSITTHAAAINYLKENAPKSTIIDDGRWVEDGKIITTAGISAGIDGALHLVEKLEGAETVDLVTKIMQYNHWKKDDGFIAGQSKKKSSQLKPKKVASKKGEPLKEATIDLVCKMPVKEGVTLTTFYKGKQHGFCSETCKVSFLKNPGKYLTGN